MPNNTTMRKFQFTLFIVLISCGFMSAQDVNPSKPIKESIAVLEGGPLVKLAGPLFVIVADDKKMEMKEAPGDSTFFHLLKPEWFESIAVFKDKEALDKYGERGDNGVVVIELKHGIFELLPKGLAGKFKSGQ